jgi:hypothetical protein
MKALGVALAACAAAVLLPSTARANPIGAGDCVTACADAQATVSSPDNGLMFALSESVSDDSGGLAVTADSGVEASEPVANDASFEVFVDENAMSAASQLASSPSPVTFALRLEGSTADHPAEDSDHAGDATATAALAVSTAGDPVDPPAAAPALPQVARTPDPPGLGISPAAVAATPEPASLLLLGTGLVGVLFYRRQLSV